ncbi:protein of unknown function [Micromonospora pattaloongensis]|uniref:DUF4360 domain-containing protein n=1 Tax=Micromonospora pattaloongensis TaxID=405436 RepID=A0A1H3QS32_9ACTN|nr:DUF4360 domain-containing protein [Micromonospora pattaloongensis]SDZ15808.1 protein of unknown function [Micromonospora pattaloongensis]
MFNMTAAGALALSMLAPTASIDQSTATAPAEKIVVDVQTVNGSGCRAGTATATTAPDNTSFSVAYDDFVAQAGGSTRATDSRKNCQINLRVHLPQGFTFAIAQADYRGYAGLAAGATGAQLAHYYFTGSAATAESSHSFAGPMDAAWHTTDRTEVAVYARCGADALFNINTELRVDAGPSGATSLMTMDATRAGVRTVFQLTWKRCD